MCFFKGRHSQSSKISWAELCAFYCPHCLQFNLAHSFRDILISVLEYLFLASIYRNGVLNRLGIGRNSFGRNPVVHRSYSSHTKAKKKSRNPSMDSWTPYILCLFRCLPTNARQKQRGIKIYNNWYPISFSRRPTPLSIELSEVCIVSRSPFSWPTLFVNSRVSRPLYCFYEWSFVRYLYPDPYIAFFFSQTGPQAYPPLSFWTKPPS